MTLPPWHEDPVSRTHDRNAFDCGDQALNAFLSHHARQSHDHGGAKTFLAVRDDNPSVILGYYSICPASIEFARTPAVVKRGLARYDVPAFRLCRLAVDRSVQSLGLGGQLLLSAGLRCIRASQDVGGVALIIDAKNDDAARWYTGYGAIPLQDNPLTLVLPLSTFQKVLFQSGIKDG